MDKKPKVAIAIATFNRLEGLKNLLDSIEAQHISADIDVRIIIVDNSLEGNAREYVESRADSYRWPLTYHNEVRPGVTYPRNRGIDDALGAGDKYLVYTDDDAVVGENWLNALYSVIEETGAAAVCGTVKVRFKGKAPWWVEKGGYAEVNHSDRESIQYGYAGNSIIRLDYIRNLKLRFDPFFSLTGGEDTAFFQAILDAGGSIIFAQNAVIYERFEKERLTLGWWLKRWYRTGNSEGLVSIRNNRHFNNYLAILFKGVLRTLAGIFGAIVTSPTQLIGRVDSFNYLRVMSRGLGFVASVFGISYEEYRDHNR